MSFSDHNGAPLVVDDRVIVLGKVTSITGEEATVSLTKYGSAVSLVFLRSELIKATFANGTVSGVITGDHPNVNDDVMLQGMVTALAQGIHNIANVGVTQDGSPNTLTFFTSEIIKATLDGNEISGALGGNT